MISSIEAQEACLGISILIFWLSWHDLLSFWGCCFGGERELLGCSVLSNLNGVWRRQASILNCEGFTTEVVGIKLNHCMQDLDQVCVHLKEQSNIRF